VKRATLRGFTLVEVLVALMIVAIGLAALMTAVSGTARTSGYLRDKTLAQWIALNRLSEVRLTLNKLGENNDTGELNFGNRTWHYDTRYFDTSVASMKRVVVRVWEGDAKTKGNPIAESSSFLGSALATPGSSNVDWTTGSTVPAGAPCAPGTAAATTPGVAPGTTPGTTPSTATGAGAAPPCTPTGAANTTPQTTIQPIGQTAP
jgi:general secretion pathway protein I